jgi:hypothetical protein
MTHMDDQVAKHIKEMILRITPRPTENQERPREFDTLNQIVRTLRRGLDYPYDLMCRTLPKVQRPDSNPSTV